MARRILVINGHPDADAAHLCAALCSAYETSARDAGHEVRRLDVGALHFEFIRTDAQFRAPVEAPDIIRAQEEVRWAEHLVLVYPLWLGSQPALLRAFLEQVFRHGYALGDAQDGRMPAKLLKGRSAHVVVTMGMPALAYRWMFGAFGERALERSVLKMCGIAPVQRTLLGMVQSERRRRRAIAELAAWGGRGS